MRPTSNRSRWSVAVGAVLVVASATAGAQTLSGEVQQGSATKCCLTNFRYTGACEATPGPGESCRDVLAYLNNLSSAGRQYCGNTIIRGGWTLVPCDGAGGGVSASPGTVTAREPGTAGVTGTMQPVSPVEPSSAPSGVRGTFIAPVDAGAAVSASEPGLINL